MSHESCDAKYESHRVRVEGKTPIYGHPPGMSLGSSRNHLYSFLYYTFNIRSLSTNFVLGQDQSVFLRASRSILLDRGQSTQLS